MTKTAHTPGPWAWFGNANSNSLYLATTHSGRRYVMSFKRWGMRGAQPQFQPGDRGLVDASELLKFAVGDRDVRGVSEAKANHSVYRMDVSGIDCADAYLIAAAPDLLEALKNVNKLISEAAMTGFNWKDGDWPDRLFNSQQKTSRAIAKAEGSTP